ncbi:MAG: iron-containing redox enzyme family protein [Candidatus Micrarchaeota archaeon]|nr:iron-containing redox enzyme family protein [Candidatus Micrarchaeota archaeon]
MSRMCNGAKMFVDGIIQNATSSIISHPFLKKFANGEIRDSEVIRRWALARYLSSSKFPELVKSAIAVCGEQDSKLTRVLEKNLRDELKPMPHPEMFRNFLLSLGIQREEFEAYLRINKTIIYPANIITIMGTKPETIAAVMLVIEVMIGIECTEVARGLRTVYGESLDLLFFDFHGVQDLSTHLKPFQRIVVDYAVDEVKRREIDLVVSPTIDSKLSFYDQFRVI